ncbi:methyltransferase domain-containing protein [Actinomadura keratinilytica]|uniref:methyltransferase domain-containing protein n=1 Tax=Actinomadura keratinilytica TaxID=547461 RepID=UPI003615A83A
MSDAEALNQRLVDELADAGVLSDRWRPAFLAVPRHLFVPDVIWVDAGDGTPTARRREDDPAAWLETAYADGPIGTQVDDGATPDTGRGLLVTSSISAPSIVSRMLHYLQVEPGMRVLEIGTGSGWNAALLAHMAGGQNVVTVEIDPGIADRARKTLAEAGVSPTVVTGDGADGYPPGAPYDRVIATAAVQRVPYAWVEQTRPGGLILTPWATAFDEGALVLLTVDEHGTAHGRFVDNTVAFMWLRAQRTPPRTAGRPDRRRRIVHDSAPRRGRLGRLRRLVRGRAAAARGGPKVRRRRRRHRRLRLLGVRRPVVGVRAGHRGRDRAPGAPARAAPPVGGDRGRLPVVGGPRTTAD